MKASVSSSTIKKVYPSRVALYLCTHLTETLSLENDMASNASSMLRRFTKGIRNILIRTENHEKWIQELNAMFPDVLDSLKTISSNPSFAPVSQSISLILLPELRNLQRKTIKLQNNGKDFKEMLKNEVPMIAAKEFLERYRDVKPHSLKCEACELEYFTQKKNSKKQIYLECQFCHHHQNSNLNLSITYFGTLHVGF